MVELVTFFAKWAWVALAGICAWIWNRQDNEIKDLKNKVEESISQHEAKELIKEAVQPVRDELGRFQQQMTDKITEISLIVRQTSDNVIKLDKNFTVEVEVQKALNKFKHKEE